MAFTVTATQGGATANGLLLRVKVLTGTAATQNGATVSIATALHASIVTTVTGSLVYGALSADAVAGAFSAEPLCTLTDNFHDTVNGEYYGSFRTTSATGTPGSTLVGSTTSNANPDMAAVEILPNGTITEDASGPAAATATGATTVTTASFTPPAGSLLVAMVGSDGAANGSTLTTMSVTDTSGLGLTWTQVVHASSTATCYAGVWLAQVPGGSTASVPAPAFPVPPGRLSPSSFPRIQPPPPPGVPNVLVPAGAGSATATALGPVANVIPGPAAASATAAALQPVVVITPSPAAASATATAQGPVPNVIPSPAAASATATALNPAILTGTIANPAAATATATAQSPALQISNSVTPGVAHATAAALNPGAVITPNAGLAHATAAAQGPSAQVSTTVTPGVAHATTTATSPGFGAALNHFAVTFTEPGPTAVLTENAFGAVLTEQKLGAALTLASFGGSLIPVSPSATCTIPGFGATLTTPAFGAVLTEGTMQQASLTLSEFNDMTINIAVTNNGSPYNLTSQNLNLLLKSQAGVPDSQALVFSSTGGSPAITITNAAQGLATAQLPNTSLNSETYGFYRLDVVNASSQQQTTVYGPIVWITL